MLLQEAGQEKKAATTELLAPYMLTSETPGVADYFSTVSQPKNFTDRHTACGGVNSVVFEAL